MRFLDILNYRSGDNIFTKISYGCQYSTILLESLRAIEEIYAMDAQSLFLNKRSAIWKTNPVGTSYLERASGGAHDAVLNKFITDFSLYFWNLIHCQKLVKDLERKTLNGSSCFRHK